MATEISKSETIISVDCRKIRKVGNAVGQTLDIEALRELGIVDENGELVNQDLTARQTIAEDGTITIKLPVADD